MFLADWIERLVSGMGWIAVFAVFLLTGAGIGCFYTPLRKVFYVFCAFWVTLHILSLVFSGYFPADWSKELFRHLQASPDTMRFWLFCLMAGGVAYLALISFRGEVFGRLFAGFFLMFNLLDLLMILSYRVELLGFLSQIPFQTVLWVSLFLALAGILVRDLIPLVAACLGSTLAIFAYLSLLQGLGERDTFFGQSPFVLFLLVIITILFRAVQGEVRGRGA